ncbi:hypothetical protein CVO96_19185 [Deinococcus koreensis]|uniref:DUF11 domain-containing protein n=2 Tax=Deinococcus koreensis TaxID=2054903 RepID=A0A2K3USN4_9DEIO|nr:hypothetical protein CVO96_19185 [Deinococcus koreensis]
MPGSASIVNTYYPGTASAGAGSTSLILGTATGDTSKSITRGDLLLVMQMQDAAINSGNSLSYGSGTGTGRGSTTLNNAGRYEYVKATSDLAGGSVTVQGQGTGGGLLNTYTYAAASTTQGQRRFQVIRVPQYSSANLSSALTAAAWNGTTGGVLALDVAGTANLNNATVNVSGKGFRGGAGRQLAGATGIGTGTDFVNSSGKPAHGGKGEGIAGTPRYVNSGTALLDATDEGYPGGSMARGAPGTAGGGGTDSNPTANDQNSGGGGGANGGGGGQGGNSWSAAASVGGIGGESFTAAFDRLTLGGGGGAGSTNNGTGSPAGFSSSGAAGGGMIFLRAGSVTGTGTLNANGAAASDSVLNDGSGGGGAGGSVLVSSVAALPSSLTVTANGGKGGTNTGGGSPHGPGGGGGGGVVVLSRSGPAISFAAGQNGTTSGGGAFGAVPGDAGKSIVLPTTGSVPGVSQDAGCLPQLSVGKTTGTPNRLLGTDATATYTITVSNGSGRAEASEVNLSDTLPAPLTYATTGTVTLTGGATRTATTNPGANAAVPAWGTFTIPGGGSVALTFTVNLNGAAVGTYQNPATVSYLNPIRTTATDTTTATYDPASSTGEDVRVLPVLSGSVFGDPNANGVIDGGESGLAGVTVQLYNAAGTSLLSTATTDSSGFYRFGVSPNATYTVRVPTSPSGQGPTTPSPASRSVPVTTASVPGQNFGFMALPTCSAVLATSSSNTGLYVLNTGSGAPLGSALRTLQSPTEAMAVLGSGGNAARVYYLGTPGASTVPLRFNDLSTGTDALAATITLPTTAGAVGARMAISGAGLGYLMFSDGTLMSFTTSTPSSTVTSLGTVALRNVAGGSVSSYTTGDMAFDSGGVLWTVMTDNSAGPARGQSLLFSLAVGSTPPSATPVDNVTVGGADVTQTLTGLAFDGAGALTATSVNDVFTLSAASVDSVRANTSASSVPISDLGSCSYPALTPALTISKAVSAAAVRPGDGLTFTLSLSNTGTAAATGVTLTDAIPANTTYVAGSTTLNGVAVADTGSAMPYAAGSLAGSAGSFPGVLTVGTGKTGTVSFRVTVSAAYPDAAPGVSNTATVTYSGGAAGGLTSNQTTTGVGTDLVVTKTGPQYISAGRTLSYTVKVSNAGLRGADGAVVRDPAVPNFSATAVSCAASGGAVCPAGLSVAAVQAGVTLTTFPRGGALTFTVEGTAGSGTIVNSASVSAPASLPDLDPANNAASATTGVINVQLTKEVRNCGPLASAAPCPATAAWSTAGSGRPGDVLEYRISYANTGSANAKAVVINDDVPSNTDADLNGYGAGRGVSWSASATPLTSQDGDDAGSLSASALRLSLGTLAPGTSGSVSFRARIR